ncbi:MAG: sel1 repeat family protein [Granulosicoccus sp.]|nr:sel1 repeat family protein [Granulosicoccus sp.]
MSYRFPPLALNPRRNPDGLHPRHLLTGMARPALVGALLLLCSAMILGAVYWLWWKPPENARLAMANGRYDVAGRYYATAANAGDPNAQNALGNLFYLGLGVKQDFDRAAELYLASAARNHAGAQLNMGNMFKQGLGVATDPMRAYAWYRMSDINGNPRAEYYMSQLAIDMILSPQQVATAQEKFGHLDALITQGLE